ncbi:hypothetical protein [Paenibacillus radicis (ex Xue et al. 2023)]|uniref:Uncharacterized protein n=1 Tax=Paenibacillus radicis (ex Xue et al. 2023) TaxID=2972489 RepID=A0ABT1YIJ8_9BACL|nr:hypothetical protein [Paenibacillus radicis (ex Xue et al. 2023)]MCR8633011.1 hypothetical protein [Paenibacillus radicis (ex Xue et al. 2023)]
MNRTFQRWVCNRYFIMYPDLPTAMLPQLNNVFMLLDAHVRNIVILQKSGQGIHEMNAGVNNRRASYYLRRQEALLNRGCS